MVFDIKFFKYSHLKFLIKAGHHGISLPSLPRRAYEPKFAVHSTMQYQLAQPVVGSIATEKYQCTITWRNGTFVADEPISVGGKDTGPDPTTLLLSSLASCKLVTMRMYIDRKGWHIPEIAVQANLYQETQNGATKTIIDCDIDFIGAVTDEQKLRLQEISARCPISKLLQGEVQVRNFVRRNPENRNAPQSL